MQHDCLLFQIQEALKLRLHAYVGKANTSQQLEYLLRQEFHDVLTQFCGAETDPEFELTAQQVRAMGYELPPYVPEYAVGKFKLSEPRLDQLHKDKVIISLIQSKDWQWINLTFDLEKK